MLVQQGVHPKVVSGLLRHTDDLYSHMSPAMHETAARALGELLAL